jgi:hypothetical protein
MCYLLEFITLFTLVILRQLGGVIFVCLILITLFLFGPELYFYPVK